MLDLHEWMVKHLDAHPLFSRFTDEELKDDPCIKCVMEDTEEGKKVARNKGSKYLAVYRRLASFDGEFTGFTPLASKDDEE